jgi:hypothetical protein
MSFLYPDFHKSEIDIKKPNFTTSASVRAYVSDGMKDLKESMNVL